MVTHSLTLLHRWSLSTTGCTSSIIAFNDSIAEQIMVRDIHLFLGTTIFFLPTCMTPPKDYCGPRIFVIFLLFCSHKILKDKILYFNSGWLGPSKYMLLLFHYCVVSPYLVKRTRKIWDGNTLQCPSLTGLEQSKYGWNGSFQSKKLLSSRYKACKFSLSSLVARHFVYTIK